MDWLELGLRPTQRLLHVGDVFVSFRRGGMEHRASGVLQWVLVEPVLPLTAFHASVMGAAGAVAYSVDVSSPQSGGEARWRFVCSDAAT